MRSPKTLYSMRQLRQWLQSSSLKGFNVLDKDWKKRNQEENGGGEEEEVEELKRETGREKEKTERERQKNKEGQRYWNWGAEF